MSARSLIDAQVGLQDLIVYADSLADARSRALKVFADVDKVLDAEADQPTKDRFCLVIPAREQWVDAASTYVKVDDTFVYFIDGFITTSKIMAIKQLRTVDSIGLKEAKDIVDKLQANPRKLDA